MTSLVCRKQVVLLLVDLAKRAFWRLPRDIQEASERHSIGILSFIWQQKLQKDVWTGVFFTIKAFFVEWTKRETVFRIGEGSIFIFVYQWEIYILFRKISWLSRKRLPMALKVDRMVVFTALATAAGQVLAYRRSLSTPSSYAFSFGFSSISPAFSSKGSWRRDFLDLLTKVKCKKQQNGRSSF